MFEMMMGVKAAVANIPYPGPATLAAGTMTAGYYGLVPTADFIDGATLAGVCGLTDGTLQNSTTDWMKFSLDGKTLFVPQKNIRHSISWASLNTATLIFGSKIITILGNSYKVRLFKGCPPGLVKSGNENGWDTISTVGSEWNRLMYHVAGKPFSDSSNTLASEGITVGDWATYSETVLNVTGSGSTSWCQETHAGNSLYQLFRGGLGVARNNGISRTTTIGCGWRPVLEPI